MTDKEKLIAFRAEVERLKDSCASPIVICDTLLSFIDSMQEEPKTDWLQELQERLDSLSKEDFEKVWAKYKLREEGSVNYDKLNTMLDDALAKETKESWNEWLGEEPKAKFKKGDTIRYTDGDIRTVVEVREDCYKLDDFSILHFNAQDNWELIREPVSEIDFEQELYKAFGHIKNFTLCLKVAKWFYDMGKNSQEPVSKPNEQLAETYLAMFDKKFPILPTLKGKQLADYKNFLNKCQQIFSLKEWGIHPIQSKLFEKLTLLWATWGAEHLQGVGRQDEKEQDIPVSEDLEKAAVEAFKQIVDSDRNNFLEIFKAGAKWQKEQLMAKAVDATIEEPEPLLWRVLGELEGLFVVENNLHDGDGVKVIIVKED